MLQISAICDIRKRNETKMNLGKEGIEMPTKRRNERTDGMKRTKDGDCAAIQSFSLLARSDALS